MLPLTRFLNHTHMPIYKACLHNQTVPFWQDEGAIAMAEMLKSNRSLRKLGLHANKIQAAGVCAICEALQLGNLEAVVHCRHTRHVVWHANCLANMYCLLASCLVWLPQLVFATVSHLFAGFDRDCRRC